jgi:uncharacterized tellurite resistance protein B-like protein
MKIERSNQQELTPEEQAHLEKIQKVVEAALADGKISRDEIQAVRALIHADKKVTVEELNTINDTIRDVLGDTYMEYDWG